MSETVPTGAATAAAAPRSGTGRRTRRNQAGDRTDLAVAIDALQGFCLGPEGRAAARSELRRLGLPVDHADDVCQEVLIRLWQRLESAADAGSATGSERDERHGEAELLRAGIVPYARRSIRNAAVDLLRSQGARPGLQELLAPPATDDDPAPEPIDPADPATALDERAPQPWSDTDADEHFAPTVRWALQRMLHERRRLDSWVVSAALTTSHLADHPNLLLRPETPVPNPASPAASAGARWAGLAYAGRDDCWADPETGAVRQRRSQALKRLDRTVAEAIDLAALHGSAGDAQADDEQPPPADDPPEPDR